MSYYAKATKQSPIDLDAMTEEYLARGGTITKCEPGPSEEITLRNGRKQKPKRPSDAPAR